MTYLDKFGITDKEANSSFAPTLIPYIIKSQVRTEFEDMGYKTVAFRGYLNALDLKDADYYYNLLEQENQPDLIGREAFEEMFVSTTLLSGMVERYSVNPNSLSFLPGWLSVILNPKMTVINGQSVSVDESKDVQWYKQSVYTFTILRKLPEIPEKKFVYAHIYSMHIPFVFNSDGTQRLKDTNNEKYYLPALEFTQTQILDIVKTILEKSSVKPIIIIQGDHGKNKNLSTNKILNAYYLPGDGAAKLYSTITPVNTFRLLFDQYFDKKMDFLPDKLTAKINGKYEHLSVSCDLK